MAGGTTRLPLGGANSTTNVAVDGRTAAESQWPEADLRRAVGRYFQTMRIGSVRGRVFDERDDADSPPVAIINETLAARLFPGQDPIGERIRLGANAGIRAATVIGVVRDIRHHGLETAPSPEVYIHYLQNPPVSPLLVFRTTGSPTGVAAALQAALREIEPTVEIASVRTMDDIRRETMAERRFLTVLVAGFGILALVLAGIGVYGVVTLVVSERRQELGIRLALGAKPSSVAVQVLRDGCRLAAIGVGSGLVLTLPLLPLLSNHLFGVSAVDPLTLSAVPVVMLALAAIASLVPAWRAMRTDPLTTIRGVG
jgi:predicted permease